MQPSKEDQTKHSLEENHINTRDSDTSRDRKIEEDAQKIWRFSDLVKSSRGHVTTAKGR